jgi:hypothetical protein
MLRDQIGLALNASQLHCRWEPGYASIGQSPERTLSGNCLIVTFQSIAHNGQGGTLSQTPVRVRTLMRTLSKQRSAPRHCPRSPKQGLYVQFLLKNSADSGAQAAPVFAFGTAAIRLVSAVTLSSSGPGSFVMQITHFQVHDPFHRAIRQLGCSVLSLEGRDGGMLPAFSADRCKVDSIDCNSSSARWGRGCDMPDARWHQGHH